MGQKRELNLEVTFTETDKECLARLVKDLVKLGAKTSKVCCLCVIGRPSKKTVYPLCFLHFFLGEVMADTTRILTPRTLTLQYSPPLLPFPSGRLQGMAQSDAERPQTHVARSC